MKTKTFIHERTGQCVELQEITPVRFKFLSDETTLAELRTAGWKPCLDPGYRGMPNSQKSNR